METLDADRLERVRRYAAVPARERDDEWIRGFEAAFWPAPLVMLAASEIDDPNGRPFLRVSARTWEPSFDFARPAALVDRLIQAGRGLVLTDEADITQVWIGLGEVVSYRLYGRAFARPEPAPPSKGFVAPGETIGLSPVHEGNFPEWARINVRRHLQNSLGIERPRAAWVFMPDGQQGVVFDLEPTRIGDEARLRSAFDDLRWLLPARIPYFRFDFANDAEPMQPF